MALDLTTVYPTDNIDATDSDFPWGKAKNESYDGARDYFPLEKTWVNELLGFLAAILIEAGTTPDGNPEDGNNSQYLDTLLSLPVPINRLSNGTGALTSSTLTLGTVDSGQLEIIGSTSSGATKVSSTAHLAKSIRQKVIVGDGRLQFENGIGVNHGMTSIFYEIDYAYVFRDTLTYGSRIRIQNGSTGIIFNDLYYSPLMSMNLILIATPPTFSAYDSITIPMITQCQATAGGKLIVYYAIHDTEWAISLSAYNQAYLQMWVDPAQIA